MEFFGTFTQHSWNEFLHVHLTRSLVEGGGSWSPAMRSWENIRGNIPAYGHFLFVSSIFSAKTQVNHATPLLYHLLFIDMTIPCTKTNMTDMQEYSTYVYFTTGDQIATWLKLKFFWHYTCWKLRWRKMNSPSPSPPRYLVTTGI